MPMRWKVKKKWGEKKSVNSVEVLRCGHRAAKLQRMQGLSTCPQLAVSCSVYAVQAKAEWRDVHILPHGLTTPLRVIKFRQEGDKTQPVGWKGSRTLKQDTWASPRLPVVVQPNLPASDTQKHPWKHEKLNLSTKRWTQLILRASTDRLWKQQIPVQKENRLQCLKPMDRTS